ncbi:MAG: hypothetical protein PHF21_02985 [Bacilli bacterium]|nr:hypothetical protein [Bacilli bacterium]
MFTSGVLFHNLTDPSLKNLFISVFQAGWFIESMWSQTLIIHLIRTEKKPIIESNASLTLTILTLLGIVLLTLIPFSPLATPLGFSPLPHFYFIGLIIIIFLYMLLTLYIKKIYINKYKELL